MNRVSTSSRRPGCFKKGVRQGDRGVIAVNRRVNDKHHRHAANLARCKCLLGEAKTFNFVEVLRGYRRCHRRNGLTYEGLRRCVADGVGRVHHCTRMNLHGELVWLELQTNAWHDVAQKLNLDPSCFVHLCIGCRRHGRGIRSTTDTQCTANHVVKRYQCKTNPTKAIATKPSLMASLRLSLSRTVSRAVVTAGGISTRQ